MMKTEIIFLLLVVLFLPQMSQGQLAVIRGTITEIKSENPLKNVNILETISDTGTISNASGEFSLMLKTGKTDLLIAIEGYKTVSKQLLLKNDTVINIELEPQINLKIRRKADIQNGFAQKPAKL